jgi:hypothetical protein
MEDAEMLADVKAYDAAKARLEDGSDELLPWRSLSAGSGESPRSGFGANTASLSRRILPRRRRYRGR